MSLFKSRSARNFASSYLAFISTTVTGLISIPLSIHFLSREQLGLWAIITVFSGYLNQMELGIGAATGRMMADSIIQQDKEEIDRWWTLTRIILCLLGLLIVIVGLALTPIFLSQMAGDYADRSEALFLCVCMVLMQGIKMPFHGVEGILIAQERFHWIPLRQCLIFWIELVVFAACLFAGLKLYAMLWGQVATLLVAWSVNWFLLSKSHPRLGWNFTGLSREKIRKIFVFSLNISGVNFVEAFTRSLPVMLLGHLGGLALVPVYTITNKAATVMAAIGMRMHQSFYPSLQRMFISGDMDRFRTKLPKIGVLTVATGLGIAGFLLCFNRMAVEFLAKPEFFAGPVATIWFSITAITLPVSTFIQMPLFAAGRLGKSVLASLLQLLIGLIMGVLAYKSFGVAGLAGVAAFLPLVLGAYAYGRSAAECTCRPWILFGPVIVWTAAAVLLVILAGFSLARFPQAGYALPLFGKQISLPSVMEFSIGGGVMLAAAGLFLACARTMRFTTGKKTPLGV